MPLGPQFPHLQSKRDYAYLYRRTDRQKDVQDFLSLTFFPLSVLGLGIQIV